MHRHYAAPVLSKVKLSLPQELADSWKINIDYFTQSVQRPLQTGLPSCTLADCADSLLPVPGRILINKSETEGSILATFPFLQVKGPTDPRTRGT